jgi:hypothetical protein
MDWRNDTNHVTARSAERFRALSCYKIYFSTCNEKNWSDHDKISCPKCERGKTRHRKRVRPPAVFAISRWFQHKMSFSYTKPVDSFKYIGEGNKCIVSFGEGPGPGLRKDKKKRSPSTRRTTVWWPRCRVGAGIYGMCDRPAMWARRKKHAKKAVGPKVVSSSTTTTTRQHIHFSFVVPSPKSNVIQIFQKHTTGGIAQGGSRPRGRKKEEESVAQSIVVVVSDTLYARCLFSNWNEKTSGSCRFVTIDQNKAPGIEQECVTGNNVALGPTLFHLRVSLCS